MCVFRVDVRRCALCRVRARRLERAGSCVVMVGEVGICLFRGRLSPVVVAHAGRIC